MHAVLSNLNVCSNKGLAERFDSTVGASTVLAPFGGARQLTPALAMTAKLPVNGETTTVSGMAWGFNPYLSQANQYAGAYSAVVESVSKLTASGFARSRMYLTFQEYFGSLRDDPKRWGKPLASLLGALSAQLDLDVGAIGGKDSMSGSFEALDVPPTLVSFAVATGPIARVTSPEFKGAGHRIVLVSPQYESPIHGDDGKNADAGTQAGPRLPRPESMRAVLDVVEHLIASGGALAVSTAGFGGLAEALFTMAVGNAVGFDVRALGDTERLFDLAYGTFVVELSDEAELPSCTRDADAADAAAPLAHVEVIGRTTSDYLMRARSFDGAQADEEIDLVVLQKAWEAPLASVYPYRTTTGAPAKEEAALRHESQQALSWSERPPLTYSGPSLASAAFPGAPRVAIPVFPGTNCEYDTARAFLRAGADPETFVVNNLTPAAVAQSARAFARLVRQSQIIAIPGGFSGGDEPDGAAKLIAAFFRAPEVTEAVNDLLEMRDGLVLGICNGFQALVKLGLVPFGRILPIDVNCPTLTFNTIGRHQSRIVRTRVASTLSPWLARCSVGDVYDVPISHGEGRFVAAPDVLERMRNNGQIATQYTDAAGNPSLALDANPNGSVLAIEGITSPDGRILGKMGHSERWSVGVYKNLPAFSRDPVIESGVDYFTC